MYAKWKGCEGIPLDQAPLFYEGVTETTAKLISSISDEIVNIAELIELKTGAEMSRVRFSIDLLLVETFVRSFVCKAHLNRQTEILGCEFHSHQYKVQTKRIKVLKTRKRMNKHPAVKQVNPQGAMRHYFLPSDGIYTPR